MTEADLREYTFQLEQVELAIEQSPSNVEFQNLKSELEDLIALTRQAIEEHTSSFRGSAGGRNSFGGGNNSNGSGASGGGGGGGAVATMEVFKPGDYVMARWLSGDNAYYPARVTSISGSSTVPVYTIKFLQYDTVESVPAGAVKPMSESKKRALQTETNGSISVKQSLQPAAAPPPPPSSAPAVPPPPPLQSKKLKGKAEIDTSKKAWQAFASKGVKKKGVAGSSLGKAIKIGERSMFRTPEHGGKVGVIGSGKGMSKEIGSRHKHMFNHVDEDKD